MHLFRVLYCSRATTRMNYETMTELLGVACARNKKDGITGLLSYSDGNFFQCLEGPRTIVSRTLARIYRDPRHADIVVVDARVVASRVFPDWGMRVAEPGKLQAPFLQLFADAFGEESGVHATSNGLLDILRREVSASQVDQRPTTGGKVLTI